MLVNILLIDIYLIITLIGWMSVSIFINWRRARVFLSYIRSFESVYVERVRYSLFKNIYKYPKTHSLYVADINGARNILLKGIN